MLPVCFEFLAMEEKSKKVFEQIFAEGISFAKMRNSEGLGEKGSLHQHNFLFLLSPLLILPLLEPKLENPKKLFTHKDILRSDYFPLINIMCHSNVCEREYIKLLGRELLPRKCTKCVDL